jgi:hypothetical protein
MHTTTRSLAWLVSNLKTDDFEELFNTELASSRMRAGVCIAGCLKLGLPVLPLNFRDPGADPSLVFMAKYVHDSKAGQFLDDSGTRRGIWLEKIERLKRRNGRLVLDYTDNHFQLQTASGDFYRTIKPMVDALVVPSARMQTNIAAEWNGPSHIIPEPVEVPLLAPGRDAAGEKVALWFGHNSNLRYLFEFMKSGMQQAAPDRLIILTNHVPEQVMAAAASEAPAGLKITLARWSRETMIKAAQRAHYALIPSDRNDPRKSGVSPGRLLTSLALGLPVVAEPLDSYLEFAEFFAAVGSPEAAALMANPTQHGYRIDAAQAIVRARFTVEAIGAQWAALAQDLLAG